MAWDGKVDVLVIGGGMICEDMVLPTLFQERRRGNVGRLQVVSLNSGIIQRLRTVFPDDEFEGIPDPGKHPPSQDMPAEYKRLIAELGDHGCVFVTTPDHLHTRMIIEAVEAGHGVVSMKPLCLKVEEAHQIIAAADKHAGYVFTEYHKRRDRAARALRYRYRKGELGEALYGHAWIEEPKYIPLDKFKLWAHRSSPFEYIGTHYADLYYYVTGLLPKRVAAFGQKKFLPTQGSQAYDAVQVVIEWENGSAFWIQTSWVCPNSNAQMTQQGMMLHCTGGEYKADHANRNCYFVTDKGGFEHYNPNFMKPFDSWVPDEQVEWQGYGFESCSQGLRDVQYILRETEGLSKTAALKRRREILAEFDANGCRAMPRQALVGVAINEAARLSVDNDSRFVTLDDKLRPRLE
jgi:predicted dehydrogenase